MPRLVTDHPLAPPEWGCDLPEGQLLVLGRKSGLPVCVAWDRLVSGTHAELTWSNGALFVRRLETAKNVIFHEGEPVVELTVSDNGPGVDGHAPSQVLEPFFTTKREGLGMGLPIALSIAEEHGGRLVLDNDPGSGLRVSLQIPVWNNKDFE